MFAVCLRERVLDQVLPQLLAQFRRDSASQINLIDLLCEEQRIDLDNIFLSLLLIKAKLFKFLFSIPAVNLRVIDKYLNIKYNVKNKFVLLVI